MPAGSCLALSNYPKDGNDAAKTGRVRQAMAAYPHTATPVYARTKAELATFFTGLEIVPPGTVWTPLWRPDQTEPTLCESSDSEIYAAVAMITH